jgi:hypothetical protein
MLTMPALTIITTHRSIEVRDAKNNEAPRAMKKECHLCARRRVGEPTVS